MLDKDVIKPSTYHWQLPLVLVKNKNESLGLCIDYRACSMWTQNEWQSMMQPEKKESFECSKTGQSWIINFRGKRWIWYRQIVCFCKSWRFWQFCGIFHFCGVVGMRCKSNIIFAHGEFFWNAHRMFQWNQMDLRYLFNSFVGTELWSTAKIRSLKCFQNGDGSVDISGGDQFRAPTYARACSQATLQHWS